ncbi:hypothetical protein [Actinomadura rudentiformis]|uniref:Uncharacterized protein n=1 Tax=Actinomadura rudentiformis TaxID=359158 RepID=A0A6H9YXJ0_9ACTN|nr:hypothetical protein [Actinomadura rudentiformis]KAB2345917.1 hypothetical protein F8566_24660 [Actinomadura rudentiformis]
MKARIRPSAARPSRPVTDSWGQIHSGILSPDGPITTLSWLPSDLNAHRWPVVVTFPGDPESASVLYSQGLSFSSFMLQHSDPDRLECSTGTTAERDGVRTGSRPF